MTVHPMIGMHRERPSGEPIVEEGVIVLIGDRRGATVSRHRILSLIHSVTDRCKTHTVTGTRECLEIKEKVESSGCVMSLSSKIVGNLDIL